MNRKVCTVCKKNKELKSFHRREVGILGRTSACKACLNDKTNKKNLEITKKNLLRFWKDFQNGWDSYTKEQGVRRLPVFRGSFPNTLKLCGETFVSDIDYDKLKNLILTESNSYVICSVSRNNKLLSGYSFANCNKKSYRLHELVFGNTSNKDIIPYETNNLILIDHKDRDVKNNVRDNLKIVTPSENTINASSHGSVKTKGVSIRHIFLKNSGESVIRYRSNIYLNNKNYGLGYGEPKEIIANWLNKRYLACSYGLRGFHNPIDGELSEQEKEEILKIVTESGGLTVRQILDNILELYPKPEKKD